MAKKKLNKTVEILDAAAAVLAAAGAPMHYTDIAAAVGEHDESIVFGAKPGLEVYTAIYNDIKAAGPASRFVKAEDTAFKNKQAKALVSEVLAKLER